MKDISFRLEIFSPLVRASTSSVSKPVHCIFVYTLSRLF